MPDTELPALSEAVHVTIVSPRGNVSGALLVIDDTPTISEVSTIPRITKLFKGFSASWIIFSGGINSGSSVSTTVIVWKNNEEFPDESVAVQVTIVSPNWNSSGASLVISGLVSTWSNADAWPTSTTIPDESIISSVMLSGPVITGWVVSSMVIVCVSDTELPEVSVAVHVTIVSPRGNVSGELFSTDLISTVSKTLPSTNSI